MHLLDALAIRLNAQDDGKGRYHADCPFCGALGATKSNRPAYHFYLFDFERGSGYQCWACGAKGRLRDLSTRLDVEGDDEAPRVRQERPEPPTPHFATPGALERYTRQIMAADVHARIVSAWQSYKPLSERTIIRERLGIGRLMFWDERKGQWYAGAYERLLVPMIVGDEIVGVRGRAIHKADRAAKWLNWTGSGQALMGLSDVEEGQHVIWCENLVDRLMAQESEPGVAALASGGLNWSPSWIKALARRKPAHVLVWFDHDLSGNGSPHHHDLYLERWRDEIEQRRKANPRLASMPFPQPPQPRGPQLAAELQAAGISASVYQWPKYTPHKADLGWALMQERKV